MSASTFVTAEQYDPPTGLSWLLKDSWTEATRHLKAVPRNPELLVFATIQPIMFIVLFVYVFKGSVNVPIDYVQYVIPGIFAQTILFNSAFTGVGGVDDLSRASSTGCGRCRCTRRPCSSAAPCPTSCAT